MKKWRSTILSLALWIVVLIMAPRKFEQGAMVLWDFVREMIQVLPSVFLLSGLLSQWISPSAVQRGLGLGSGFRGNLMAIALGSVSAGPIFAAFPLAQTLQKKGASTMNLALILSSWAVIKLPMIAMEAQFLGVSFALVRYLATIPTLFLVSWLCARFARLETGSSAFPSEPRTILPGYNCQACGYTSCTALETSGLSPQDQRKACVFIQ